ncbi:MAG: hypothetical protein STSR0008_17800 [Ignavibacterium sp.]
MLFNDEATKKIIREGKTIGCFYIESPGMRSLLQKLQVDTFEMLTAASSVIRPGVAESGMMQEFIARHKNPKRRKYLVPEMEKYLGETYGVMIYQEDVMKVVHHIAGLTLEEADVLRRAMSGKMRSHQAMQLIVDKFFSSCKEKGFSDFIAQELWRQIQSFAGYAFCKAHSASFALLSFQVAFLKAHYPAEFMASVLSNGGGFYSAAVYIQESRRLGLEILLPSINESDYEYFGDGKIIRIGLMAIKNLSYSSIEKILEERKRNGKFVSLADFIVRTKLGYKETALLIKSGAMDCLNSPSAPKGMSRSEGMAMPKGTPMEDTQNRPTLLRLLDIYFKLRKINIDEYGDLFLTGSFHLENEIKTDKDYSLEDKCRMEYEIFDYTVTKHPLYFYKSLYETGKFITASQLDNYKGKRVRILGWYMTSKRIRTKKGDIMKFLSLEDLTGTFECVLFPKVYNQFADKTLSMGPYIIEGKVDAENLNNIVVDNLEIVTNEQMKTILPKDSVSDVYIPDDEGLREEEIILATKLNLEKMMLAYI